MQPVNRQDVINIVETARNRIMERMVTKQDLTVLSDTIKNLTLLHQQSQQLLKQSEYQRSQLTRRVVALETRLASFENEVRVFAGEVVRAVEHKSQQVVVPAQPQPDQQPQPGVQYAYRPS